MPSIVSRSKKFIFLKVSRAASSTVEHVFKLTGMVDESSNDVVNGAPDLQIQTPQSLLALHYNMADLLANNIATQEEADTFPVYAFYRDPIDRFVSGVAFSKYMMPEYAKQILPDVASMSYDNFLDNIDLLKKEFVIFAPQSYWLDNPKVTVFSFNSFSDGMKTMLSNHGCVDPKNLITKERIKTSLEYKELMPELTDAQKLKILSVYGDDISLAPTGE